MGLKAPRPSASWEGSCTAGGEAGEAPAEAAAGPCGLRGRPGTGGAALEALLALRFLEEGCTRNAAGKAFQAWRALSGALLALERDKILERLESEEQRRWLLEKAVPRVSTSRLKALAQLLEETGIPYYNPLTSTALDLHDYQYHGPDPAAELSKYTSPEEAARDILYLLEKLAEIAEKRVKPRLREAGKWSREHEEALQRLREKLAASHQGANSPSGRPRPTPS